VSKSSGNPLLRSFICLHPICLIVVCLNHGITTSRRLRHTDYISILDSEWPTVKSGLEAKVNGWLGGSRLRLGSCRGNPSNSRAHSSSMLPPCIGERQANPPVQVRKSRVKMQRLKIRCHIEEDQAALTMLIPLFQPSECMVVFSQCRVNLCQ
jgi:hypothetical protein